MNDTTLVDRVMDSLAFEIEAVPREDEKISSASNSSPLKVKIKIRKKNRKHLLSGGIISIPKINRPMYSSEKLRLSSSDQTIMSFDVFMERGESATKPLPRQKRILQLFKRGGCLGIQNDEDHYEYSIGTSKKTNQENRLLEPMKSFSNDTLCKLNYTLAKNYSTIEASHGNKSKHKDFLGKCKPGGCLDPPFNEEKYSYLPKLIMPESEQSKTKMKQNESECNKEINNESSTKFAGIDFIHAGVKKEKSRSLLANDIFLMPTKDSNSIITFPSISPSRDALNKPDIQRRSKSLSSSKENRSYNDSNQQLETYYISPKIKTINKTPKSVIGSYAHIENEDLDDPTAQNQEQLLHETKLEAQTLPLFLTKTSERIPNIESTHGRKANLKLEANNLQVENENSLLDEICEEIIPNDTKNNLILSSKSKSITSVLNSISSPMTLTEQYDNFDPEIITRSEKDNLTSVKVFPEIKTNTEIIISGEEKFYTNAKDSKKLEDDLNNKKNYSKSELSFGVQEVASRKNIPSNYNNNEFQSPPNKSSIEGMSYLPKKTEEALPSEIHNYEKVVAAPLNHNFDVHYSQKRDSSPEIQLEEKSQRITEIKSSLDNTIINYKNSIEKIIALSQDLSENNENLKTTDTAAEAHLKERDKPVIGVSNITKSAEINVEENREMRNIISQEALETIDTTEHLHTKENSQSIKNVSRHMSDSSVIKDEHTDETVIAQPKDSFKDGHLKIIDKDVEISQEMDKPITEIMSITQKFDEDEIPIELQYSSLDKDDLKGGITSKVHSQKGDNLNIKSITTSSEENVLEDFERRENIIEDGKNKISSDLAVEVFSVEKLISDTVNSSLNSEKVKEIEQILKYNNKDFRDSFTQKEEDKNSVEGLYSDKRDVVSMNTDKDVFQDNSEFHFLSTAISSEKSKNLHEVNSEISNTVHKSSSTAKLQNITNTIVPKIDSSQNKINDKVPEATSDNYMMSKSTELSDINTLSKPIEKNYSQINIKTNSALNLSSNIPNILKKSSSNNVNKSPTISFNNGVVKKNNDRNLKDTTSKKNLDKEIIHLDLAFQSFYTDNDESVIKTLEFRSISEIKRYPNDNVLQFKTVIIPNEGRIKIPIDADKDLLLQIKTDQKIKSQDDESIKSLPERNTKLDLNHKSSLMSKDDNRGITFSSIHPATKDKALSTLMTSAHNRINISDSSLEQSLDSVYKEKLLPLHKVIKKLKDDIDGLTNQQTLVKDKLNKTKGVHSNRIQMAGKNCGCIEMPFK